MRPAPADRIAVLAVLASLLVLSACSPPVAPAPTATTAPSAAAALPTARSAPAATAAPPTATTAPTEPPAPTPAPVPAGGPLAREHLAALSEDIGPRLPGSEEEFQAAEYVKGVFANLGYEVKVQDFSFTDEDDEELESANVIAVKPGMSTREIIVGAHYDATDDGRGADDNASGVAVLLAVAALVKDQPAPYTIRFVAFGAEENDLDGSFAFVDEMDRADIRNTAAMINLDSLIAGDIAYVYGDAGPGTLRDWIIADAQAKGLELDARTAADLDEADGTPCDCADYDAFQEAGIAFAYFEATNWNLGDRDGLTQVDPEFGEDGVIRHTEYDTIDYIDTTFPGRIDHHLDLFVTLLYDALTQYQVPE